MAADDADVNQLGLRQIGMVKSVLPSIGKGGNLEMNRPIVQKGIAEAAKRKVISEEQGRYPMQFD